MKTKSSLKKICQNCKIFKRYNKKYVFCKNLKHKQRQA